MVDLGQKKVNSYSPFFILHTYQTQNQALTPVKQFIHP